MPVTATFIHQRKGQGAAYPMKPSKVVITYPNGDKTVVKTDKKTGETRTVSHARIREDGKRERDGR